MATNATKPEWNDLFLTAALEPEKWPEALEIMANQCGAAHGQLIGIGGGRDVPFNIVTNIDPSHLREFIDIGGASPAFNFRIAASNRALAQGQYDGVLFEQHYDDAIQSLESDRYATWCDEVDIPYGCQTNLIVDDLGLVGFATLRKRREGRSTAGQRRIFAEAAAAARRAVRLQERIEGDQAKLLAGAFDAISATVFVLNSRGQVQAMTQAAEQLLSNGDIGLRDGQLEALGTPISLGQAVSALVTDAGCMHIRLRVDRPGAYGPLYFEGFRLPSRSWSLGLPHAILLSRPPQRDRAGLGSFLTALYRLSAAEADIAVKLFDGKGRAEICEVRQVTAETLRGQIKSIHAKTGAANEADLMRLLAAIIT